MRTREGKELGWRMQRILIELAEMDKTAPDDVDVIVQAMIGHLRSWRPVSVAPLGVLPPPTDGPPLRVRAPSAVPRDPAPP